MFVLFAAWADENFYGLVSKLVSEFCNIDNDNIYKRKYGQLKEKFKKVRTQRNQISIRYNSLRETHNELGTKHEELGTKYEDPNDKLDRMTVTLNELKAQNAELIARSDRLIASTSNIENRLYNAHESIDRATDDVVVSPDNNNLDHVLYLLQNPLRPNMCVASRVQRKGFKQAVKRYTDRIRTIPRKILEIVTCKNSVSLFNLVKEHVKSNIELERYITINKNDIELHDGYTVVQLKHLILEIESRKKQVIRKLN
ncbi:hypothetical protein [Heterosigma akashiwo virus 01]|uniref:DUF3627 domain-containing protein n=1 Tax=Heterosigma akashiwo virus 01 TaxID=97195 RepID=A0A1C9C5C2_HAV01|nr:hypothetical protein D1R72_gp158 [Heterosigma akashiwo virus 01]AOM63489.1 hypothetical protein [Heterosigma akashiwo virus 01]